MGAKKARLSPDAITAMTKQGRSFDCAAHRAASLRMTHEERYRAVPNGVTTTAKVRNALAGGPAAHYPPTLRRGSDTEHAQWRND